MKTKLVALLLTAQLFAQSHPPGVSDVAGSIGCTYIAGSITTPLLTLFPPGAKIGRDVIIGYYNQPQNLVNCILSPVVALQIGAVAFVPGVPLDVVLGFPNGCYMYLFADILSIPIIGTNTCQPNIAYRILTIPNDNNIVGTTLYMQIIGINDTAPSTGWVTQAIQVIVFP